MLADTARHEIDVLRLMHHDLLRATGRQSTERAYDLFGRSLDRLMSTTAVFENLLPDAVPIRTRVHLTPF